jgi:ribosomal protein L19E
MTPRAYAAARALAQDPNATPAERDTARLRIAEHEAKHGRSLDPGKRPWWTLKIARKGACVWLGNCREFRRAIRALRDGAKQHEYMFEWQTVKAVQDEQVEWLWFSDQEP